MTGKKLTNTHKKKRHRYNMLTSVYCGKYWPLLTSSRAVSFPIPVFAPVTMTTLPSILPWPLYTAPLLYRLKCSKYLTLFMLADVNLLQEFSFARLGPITDKTQWLIKDWRPKTTSLNTSLWSQWGCFPAMRLLLHCQYHNGKQPAPTNVVFCLSQSEIQNIFSSSGRIVSDDFVASLLANLPVN